MSMSPEDLELVDLLDTVSYGDDAPDWRTAPELGEEDDEEEDDEEDTDTDTDTDADADDDDDEEDDEDEDEEEEGTLKT